MQKLEDMHAVQLEALETVFIPFPRSALIPFQHKF